MKISVGRTKESVWNQMKALSKRMFEFQHHQLAAKTWRAGSEFGAGERKNLQSLPWCARACVPVSVSVFMPA